MTKFDAYEMYVMVIHGIYKIHKRLAEERCIREEKRSSFGLIDCTIHKEKENDFLIDGIVVKLRNDGSAYGALENEEHSVGFCVFVDEGGNELSRHSLIDFEKGMPEVKIGLIEHLEAMMGNP